MLSSNGKEGIYSIPYSIYYDQKKKKTRPWKSRVLAHWWEKKDLNQRRLTPADLQSASFSRTWIFSHGLRERTWTANHQSHNLALSARRTKCRTLYDCLQTTGKPYVTGNSEFFCFWTSVFKWGERCLHFGFEDSIHRCLHSIWILNEGCQEVMNDGPEKDRAA